MPGISLQVCNEMTYVNAKETYYRLCFSTFVYSSRAMTATLDKTSDSLFHDFILKNFGMTPFINTFPDFMAGGAVMITALFIAAGMEVCKKSPFMLKVFYNSP